MHEVFLPPQYAVLPVTPVSPNHPIRTNNGWGM
ncbi:Uncharacterised protein [Shigella sonnei]|nr:Uncharacterised protein [Shigella sonnei]CSS92035.1 Uncharacterised protein [Shigella sonnei]